jgi:serine/threonine protein kinase
LLFKLLRADSERPGWRVRFLKERQLLAFLNHSSIPRLIDAGHTDDGRPYLVMEYVDGVPIDVYTVKMDLRKQLLLFLRVCEGVSHAHSHLIIHRDLKPSNILVDASGQPKLLDFGIAKLLDETKDPTRTIDRNTNLKRPLSRKNDFFLPISPLNLAFSSEGWNNAIRLTKESQWKPRNLSIPR